MEGVDVGGWILLLRDVGGVGVGGRDCCRGMEGRFCCWDVGGGGFCC